VTKRSLQDKVDSTSWHWLGQGRNDFMECSRSEIMKYKSAFTEEQWEGMQKTWEIVEDRARVVEKKVRGRSNTRRGNQSAYLNRSLCDRQASRYFCRSEACRYRSYI